MPIYHPPRSTISHRKQTIVIYAVFCRYVTVFTSVYNQCRVDICRYICQTHAFSKLFDLTFRNSNICQTKWNGIHLNTLHCYLHYFVLISNQSNVCLLSENTDGPTVHVVFFNIHSLSRSNEVVSDHFGMHLLCIFLFVDGIHIRRTANQ